MAAQNTMYPQQPGAKRILPQVDASGNPVADPSAAPAAMTDYGTGSQGITAPPQQPGPMTPKTPQAPPTPSKYMGYDPFNGNGPHVPSAPPSTTVPVPVHPDATSAPAAPATVPGTGGFPAPTNETAGKGLTATTPQGIAAPAAQGVAAPGQPAQTTFNASTPYLSQIASVMQNAWGRAPTDAEVNQWGSNIDANYFAQIQQAILNSTEARAFAQSHPPGAPVNPAPATPATTPTGGTDWSTGDWDAARVSSYFASRGVTPNGTSPDYWATQWNSWGKSDPNYFLQRLSQAEEFGGGSGGGGGGGATTPAAGSTATAPTSAYTDQIRQLLLGRIAADSAPFDPNSDPGIQTAMGGAQQTADRTTAAERRALSERLFAGGDLTSSTTGQQIQQSAERNAGSLSTLKGNMILQEVDKRRTDLNSLLQQATASGDADLARQTQVALANLQAMLTREGYGWNWAQFQTQQNALPVRTVTGG